MSTLVAATRHDLTDAEWTVLQPLLPAPPRRGRPRRWPVRGLVDGVRHRVRVGCPWRDVPDRYGPWWRIYGLFAAWQVLGVWARAEQALIAAGDRVGKLGWEVSVDSTVNRAPPARRWCPQGQCRAGRRGPADHALGRSRGGLTTKIHAAAEAHRGLLAHLATPFAPVDDIRAGVPAGPDALANLIGGQSNSRSPA